MLGARVPLPIQGTGQFTIVYLDDQLRVFRSGGALAVQVREACLPGAAGSAALVAAAAATGSKRSKAPASRQRVLEQN